MLKPVVAFFALVLLSLPALAADAAVTGSAVPGYGSFFEMAVGLVVVIGLIVILASVFRKLNLVNMGGRNCINILASHALSSKDRLLLVQVGEEQILVGLSPGNINKIHQLETPVAVEREINGQAQGRDFAATPPETLSADCEPPNLLPMRSR